MLLKANVSYINDSIFLIIPNFSYVLFLWEHNIYMYKISQLYYMRLSQCADMQSFE